MSDKIWVCSACGSPDVDEKCWVNVNDKRIYDRVETDEYWCNKCKEYTDIVDVNEYKIGEDEQGV